MVKKKVSIPGPAATAVAEIAWFIEAIDNAMKLIEDEFNNLKDVLPKNFSIFSKDLLRKLLRIFNKEVTESRRRLIWKNL